MFTLPNLSSFACSLVRTNLISDLSGKHLFCARDYVVVPAPVLVDVVLYLDVVPVF